MDVSFEKISRLGTDCFRYIPVLNESAVPFALKDTYQELSEARKDLSTLKTDDYWDIFFKFYSLTRIIETRDDASIRFYQLKPEVTHHLPSKLAMVYAVPHRGVSFEPSTFVLASKPFPGQMQEFVVLEGGFQFNEGTFFDPFWSTYCL